MFESDDPLDHYHYAHELLREGRYGDAIRHFKYAISLDPDRLDSEVYVFAAWTLATCPIAELRDGQQAIQYATKACELDDWLEPWPMTALAAAYAQAGEFQKAIEHQTRAIELYGDSSYDWLKGGYREKQHARLQQYKQSQPTAFDPEP